MVFIHKEEIVEVSSHLFCGCHGRKNAHFLFFGKCRKDPGKHIRLNLGSNAQVCVDPLLLRRYTLKIDHIVLQLRDHPRKAGSQSTDLIHVSGMRKNFLCDLRILLIGIAFYFLFDPDDALQNISAQKQIQYDRKYDQHKGSYQSLHKHIGHDLRIDIVHADLRADKSDLLPVNEQRHAVGVYMAKLVVQRVKAILCLSGVPGLPHILMNGRILIDDIPELEDLPAILRLRRLHGGIKHVVHLPCLLVLRIDEVDIAQAKVVYRVKKGRKPVLKGVIHIKPLRFRIEFFKGNISAVNLSRIVLCKIPPEGFPGRL